MERIIFIFGKKEGRTGGCGPGYLLGGLEGVLQTDGAVEHKMVGSGILAVGAEVAQTHELEGGGSLDVGQGGLQLAAGENFQRTGVQAGQIILACSIGIGVVE